MPRCAPCIAFAERKSPPAPQVDREWTSKADIIASASAGCGLCMLCWHYVADNKYNHDHRYLPVSMRLWLDYSDPSYYPFGRIGFMVNKRACSIRLSDNASQMSWTPSPSDGNVILQAQQLLAKCVEYHGECGRIDHAHLDGGSKTTNADTFVQLNKLGSLPRRLLDLSRGSDVLVIDVEAWISDGTSSVAELSQYCTLSYRWGATSHSCVLRAPFARETSFDIEIMPQTFKDGIEVTRGLGIRFLWIDALCIVQPGACGDYMDWNAEGPRMGSIYHNAVCTIAATSAHSATDGFLSKTDSKRNCVAPCEIIQHLNNGGTRTRLLTPRPVDFLDAVTSSDLNGRGWVTQERLLSRRILHFTLYGVIWECRNAIEHGHSTVFEVIHGASSGYIRTSAFGKERWTEWMEFVVTYSKTEFTNFGDRLVALASVARLVHRNLDPSDVYYAGLWKSRLLADLSWATGHSPRSSTPPRLKIAPTWSWASVHGEIRYYSHHCEIQSSLVQVLDVHLTLAQCDSPYGNVKEGWIKFLAQVLTISLPTDGREKENCLPDPEDGVSKWCTKISRSVWWDEWQGDTTEEEEYKVLPFQLVYDGLEALKSIHTAFVVEQVHAKDLQVASDSNAPTYRRVGLLVDKLSFNSREHVGKEEPPYNFGKPKQDMETLFLV